MSKTKDVIVWIDVETTGTNPQEDHLLEVAALVTDTQLNLLDDEGYHAVIHYPERDAAWIREDAAPIVQEMHDKSGLWGRLSAPGSVHRSSAEQGLLEYIKRFAPEPRRARIAGNSVRLDLNFLDADMPDVAEHLHYRIIDVSTVAALAGWWGKGPTFRKELKHEAMSDIRESIDELRFLRERMGTWA